MKGPFSRLARIWATLRKPKSQPNPQLLSDTRSPALPKVTPSEKQASPQRKPAERPLRRYERHLIVGVDFGTSSTKVIWQDLSGPYFELFRWRPELNGLDSVLLPSTVSVRGGTLVFGSPAPLDGDVWLPSIKLCILCIRNASVCRCDASAATRGQIRLAGRNAGAPAEALACLFLAHVFQTVEKHLEKIFPNDDVILIWNIGCPMDHLDALDSRSSWHKMAGVAMQLRGRISNPAGLSLLDEAIRLMSIFVPPPDPNFFIQPEGMAAIKAFLESPRGAEAKTYAIVDVGAGTTEVSFFFNGSIQSKGGLLQPSYLADSNEAVGGGKFDIELADKWRCDVESARRRKEQGKEQIPYVESLGAIRQQYDLTCRKILKERKLTAKDNKRFDLFIIGGGGRLPILRDLLTRCQLPGEFVRERTQQLTPPTNLRNRADVEAHYDLLANACGLASSLDWEYYPPREVPPMLPPRSGLRHDRDELYPK